MGKQNKQTDEQDQAATWTYTVDGTVKTRPARLDGWSVDFVTIPDGATLAEAAEVLGTLSETPEAGVAFLRDALQAAQAKEFDAWTKAKDRVEGQTYTRDEVKKLPPRYENLTKDAAQAFASGWKIEAPKEETVSQKARMKAQLDAASQAMLSMLRTLAEANADAAETQLASAIAAGLLPADTTL